METTDIKVLDKVVVRFSGDSGDGMQLAGNIFTNVSAGVGNQVSTFPDYPAEIRAPQGSLSGVSGFQVSVGMDVHTPGDKCDVLIAMNPAALKQNVKFLKQGGVIIVDIDSFKEADLKKALFQTNEPFKELGITAQVVEVPVTSMTKAALADKGLDNKSVLKCRNIFALGLVCWLFDRPIEAAIHHLQSKFAKKPTIFEANREVLQAGYNYGHNIHASVSTYRIETKNPRKGVYTDINGNTATAWGLIMASERSGRPLFLGSYPITPATDILHELAKRKDLGVTAVQMEDEIAGVCSAIGASFAGDLAVTSTSGPGLALKGEGIGLAVIAELPLVIIDVMRGGPSTGMPTKTEQTDLMQALYGRNGESPLCVLAATTPTNCFDMAFEAARIAIEHMTPVILLTDAFIGNGSSAWRVPEADEYPEIHPRFVPESLREGWKPYKRDEKSLVRYWALPGTEGLMHRVGGLEKDSETGAISTDPANHEKMVALRREKVARIADDIPRQEVLGDKDADTLLLGWGGTYGHLRTATGELNAAGIPMAFTQLAYINPLPRNMGEIMSRYKRVIVAELNSGMCAEYLQARFPATHIDRINKVQGQPFQVSEIVDKVREILGK
ncbi:MAG: 2-oxoacid:acceptor oxidoreductase subunit alpha [Candidatus Amulumruptor caecigallinarius]|uniref:2-oxoacid:acceptor oxidoreductase subunit alpha n=1 Tax=Candidatus Amulumruptor caecigallinarius TaxID=2109911 RepID=A0A4Q0UAG9_9BACT|nr:MAG: 2-oxoacid:acceptor oxidoreductase subunit alpha [Candidatus Amulumruptor caecigallinarius]HJE38797.1 2-oxoacid:acceptor oxidoreductase subunit alpha [Candidatus Amulumruptor caecigallinarius]